MYFVEPCTIACVVVSMMLACQCLQDTGMFTYYQTSLTSLLAVRSMLVLKEGENA